MHHNHNHNQNNNNNNIHRVNSAQACAACKYQRRKCPPDCILAPYFPHDRQRQFLNAHKLFGVSNITKIIRHLDQPEKDAAMRTIIFQSDVRASDPVGGCYRLVRQLQRQIDYTKAELDIVLRQLALCRAQAQAQAQARLNHQHQLMQHLVDDTTTAAHDDSNILNYDTIFGLDSNDDIDDQQQQQENVNNIQSEIDVSLQEFSDAIHGSIGNQPSPTQCNDFKGLDFDLKFDYEHKIHHSDEANLRENKATIEDEGQIQCDRNRDFNDAETLLTLTKSSTR